MGVDLVGLVTHQALAAAADHHYRVHVLVALERRIAARCHLEIAKLRRRIAALEEVSLELRSEMADLRVQFETLRKQFE